MSNEEILAKRKIFAGSIKGAFDQGLSSAFATLGLTKAADKAEGGIETLAKGGLEKTSSSKWKNLAKSGMKTLSSVFSMEEKGNYEELAVGSEVPVKGSKWERFIEEMGLNREISAEEYEDIMVRQMQEDHLFR